MKRLLVATLALFALPALAADPSPQAAPGSLPRAMQDPLPRATPAALGWHRTGWRGSARR